MPSFVGSVLIPAVVAILGGGLTASVVTGRYTLKQKQQSRLQKRRAGPYVEAVAWMRLEMARYRAGQEPSASQESTGATGEQPVNPTAVDPDAESDSPVTGKKLEKAGLQSTEPANKDTGLDSNYFATVRAQIITFGSHDMSRAFDRWTDAFGKVISGHKDELFILDAKINESSSARKKASRELEKLTYYEAIFPADGDRNPGTTNPPVDVEDAGFPDGKPGCLTRAVECCAAWELRTGGSSGLGPRLAQFLRHRTRRRTPGPQAVVEHEQLLLPSVSVLPIDEAGRVLLVRQAGHDDEWDVLGGAVDVGESPATAAVNQAREAISADVQLVRLVDVLGGPDYEVSQPNGDHTAYFTAVYEARIIKGSPAPTAGKLSELAWFTPGELPNLQLSGFSRALLHATGRL